MGSSTSIQGHNRSYLRVLEAGPMGSSTLSAYLSVSCLSVCLSVCLLSLRDVRGQLGVGLVGPM